MDRVKCTIRALRDDDRSMLTLLAEETLHPLAEAAGHPERFRASDFLELLDRAEVYVAEVEGALAGFLAVEPEEDTLALRCICISPAYEARGVANQLVDWAEGLAIEHRLGRLTARVPSADHPSRHLYGGHDFTPAGASEGSDVLVLEKRLPTAEA